MIVDWCARGAGRDLIVFCNGWGMDRWPLSGLAAEPFDVVVLSDYHLLDEIEQLRAELLRYRRCYLICWSMGVWAGQRLFSRDRDLFTRCIAINGTLQPVNDRFGIPVEIFAATLEEFSSSILERFYRRMCKETGVFTFFHEHRPQRSLASQRRELAVLQSIVSDEAGTPTFYDSVIISGNDLIIPTRNQQAFWQDRRVIEIDGCHYPFSRWQRWSDILDLVGRDER
ncbi:alpha/beta fold hydrolase [Desulfofustis glycolicus]|uniref:Biotin synthesis protein BioG n=1 Tax=Desulfofustis glycolicus DSM 9705 TaxID=1121409 RepID=A0A1M5X9S4_9BACT|nr:alpha/beta fold hydrolase [Desulfofustis glycolicus]MCB2218153.1 DUF452 family protein [Desulfobulbaceae bacterium]SHH96412.1 biotin synthesis protein BioG [Desulfofustis glycolicus DSM 9705]